MQSEPRSPSRARAATAVLVSALSVAGVATADSTPIGRLPKGPTTTVVAHRGSLVAVALPKQPASSGLVWRLARRVDPSILRQVSEADVGPSVVIVYRATGLGTAAVRFALTRGDTSSTAIRSATYSVRVTR